VYAVCCLPSVTLGKAFAEYFLGFAVCRGHTTNLSIPVVNSRNVLMRLDLWRARNGKYVVIVLAVPIGMEQQIPNSISWRWGGSVSTNHL